MVITLFPYQNLSKQNVSYDQSLDRRQSTTTHQHSVTKEWTSYLVREWQVAMALTSSLMSGRPTGSICWSSEVNFWVFWELEVRTPSIIWRESVNKRNVRVQLPACALSKNVWILSIHSYDYIITQNKTNQASELMGKEIHRLCTDNSPGSPVHLQSVFRSCQSSTRWWLHKCWSSMGRCSRSSSYSDETSSWGFRPTWQL